MRYVVEGNEVRLVKVRPVMELAGFLRIPDRPAVSIEEMEEGLAVGAADDAGPA